MVCKVVLELAGLEHVAPSGIQLWFIRVKTVYKAHDVIYNVKAAALFCNNEIIYHCASSALLVF